ncbi:MAG TPA: ROK family protein [Candidatus Bathyarchaeia archaeon]|nr:ROK family protein [Candidatus Bathyarchaeia archaeon]
MKIICFDIGKTKILAAVLKIGRGRHKIFEMQEQKNPHNSKKIEKIILDSCQAARKKYWVKKVAISAAHLVDSEKKIVSQGEICYGADVFDFGFLEAGGFSVRIENDGRCFALGEYYFGKGQAAENILAIALGTEIGGGCIMQGKNYRGHHGSALEISHISASYDGKWIDWGILCVGKGIEDSYRKETGKKLSSREIFFEAEKNNKKAKEIINKAANILGIGTASLVNILDPEIIIFGGGLSKQKNFVDKATIAARKNILNKKANYKFAISSLGNKANLLGAASLYK